MKKLIEKFKNLSKRTKIIILVALIVIILAGVTLSLYLVLGKEEKKSVLITQDNFTYKDGVLSILDANKAVVGKYSCKNKNIKNCYVAFTSTNDTFDKSFKMHKDNTVIEDRSSIYLNKYVFIHDNNKDQNEVILYDLKNNKKIGTFSNFKNVSNKSSKYIIVRLDNTTYLYNLETNEKVFNYDYIGNLYDDNKFIVSTEGKYKIVDESNKNVTGLIDEIKSYNSEYAVICKDKVYSLVDYKGNVIITGYDFIKPEESFISVIKDNVLNIVDYEGNSLIADSINLDSTNYNGNIIYDEDNILIDDKKAFAYSLDGVNLNVSLSNNNNYVYNLYEGLYNKNLNYYNYYDGVLYFFSDEDKTKLIGKYACNNKNSVNEETTFLTNCYLANDKDSDLSIPIFNNRYVFVTDVAVVFDDKTVKTFLYDLSSNKVLGNYIDVYSDSKNISGATSNGFSVNGTHYITAKNKESKLGILKVMTGNVSKVVNFSYDNLSILNDNYVIGQKDNKYVLLDYENNELTNDYNDKYYKILNDKNKFDVYSFGDNKKVLSESYSYINFYENFMVTISDANVLFVKDYNNVTLAGPIGVSSKLATVEVVGDSATITASSEVYKYNITASGWVRIEG